MSELRPKGKDTKNAFYKRFKDYNDYLKSNEWKQIRKLYFKGKRKSCLCCKSTKIIQLHHKSYKRLGTTSEIKDLISVCNSCHKKIHKLEKDNKISVTKATNIYIKSTKKYKVKIIKRKKNKKLTATKKRVIVLKLQSDKLRKEVLIKELRVKGVQGEFMKYSLATIKNIHTKYINNH